MEPADVFVECVEGAEHDVLLVLTEIHLTDVM